MTLYIDLVLLENIIMNYIIILATGMVCRVDIKFIKIFIGSFLGAVYAIFVYVIKIAIYINPIVKLLISISMIYISFKPRNIKVLLKQLLIFYLTSFCFGGTAYYLLHNIKSDRIKMVNGILIGTYPIKIAILGGIVGFVIINISFKMMKSRLTQKDMIYEVEIFYKGKCANLNVIVDTGNLLTEPITGTPVLIVEAKKLKSIIPENILDNIEDIIYNNSFENIDEDLKLRCSIIPFSSIGKNNGIILGVRPDYIKIYNEEGEKVLKKVVVGIYNEKIAKSGVYSGLIGLNLLN